MCFKKIVHMRNGENEALFQELEWSKAVLRLRIAATSISVYVIGWCGHVFESHSQ